MQAKTVRIQAKIQESVCVCKIIYAGTGGIIMSPKELSYIEDALAHEKFLKTQCQDAMEKLQDAELKSCVQEYQQKHQQIFDSIYKLV